MAVRLKSAADKNRRFKVDLDSLKPEQQGYLRVKNLTQDGVVLSPEESETILEVPLAKPLASGESTTFSLNFEGQVPDVIRRAGKKSAEGIAFLWHNGTQKWPNMIMKVGMLTLILGVNFTVFGEILMLKLP